MLNSHTATKIDNPDLDRDGQVKRKTRGRNKALNKELGECDIQAQL